jgi:hypothetical protein
MDCFTRMGIPILEQEFYSSHSKEEQKFYSLRSEEK